MVEILYLLSNETSTDFILLLSMKYDPVEVVEIVEVYSILKEERQAIIICLLILFI
jgi:hypothetical protein